MADTSNTSDSFHSPLCGYHGQYALIDLAQGELQAVPWPEGVLRNFLGGSGLGTYLLLHSGTAALDPLAPAAWLCFVFSPLVGSPLTTSAKFAVVSKSPLTERLNDSLASSQFALAGKRNGYDALVLHGAAPEWSVLVLDDGKCEILPAQRWLGATCQETESGLRSELGRDFSIASIGTAGENLVRYATISHDGRHAGRGGSGAVLGSKRIKAIAVRGSQRTPWADPAGLVAASRELSEKSFGPATAKYRELGTASNLLAFNRLGTLPTRNFQQGTFAAAAALSPEQVATAQEKARASCAACTIGCEHLYPLKNLQGQSTGTQVRMEYENLFALGPLCGIEDPQAVLAASHRCDELGLDTISTGGTIAFAMECAERGLIDAPGLRFGNAEALLDTIDKIAARQGLGDLLAEGSRRAAEKIGQNSLDFAPQVKGLEIPGYEPRALQTMALGFAVGSRGADHNRSGAYEVDFSSEVDRRRVRPESAHLAIATEDKAALMDSLIFCKFLRGVFADFFAEASTLLNLVTGWDSTGAELHRTAERIVTAKKLFNIRAGWQPEEDTLPARFLNVPLADDPQAVLTAPHLQSLIAAYNSARGWSPQGWVPPSQIEQFEFP